MSDTSRFSINLCIKIMIYVIPKGSPVQFLGPEDPLQKGMLTHLSVLGWRMPHG